MCSAELSDNTGDFEHLKTAIGKLRLTMPICVSTGKLRALGFGFAAGFSGCFTWRSSRNDSGGVQHDIIATSPSVVYEVLNTRGENSLLTRSPANPSMIQEIREPIVKAYVLCPMKHRRILQLILENAGRWNVPSRSIRAVMLHANCRSTKFCRFQRQD